MQVSPHPFPLRQILQQAALPRSDQAARIMPLGYTQTERLSDGVVHALGVVMSVIAVAVLLRMVIPIGGALLIMAATIYSVGLIAMFGLSAAYNLIVGPKWKEAIRRYDHAAIYMMIAGTYTPFALIGIGGPVGYSLLALVWLLAIIGLVLKLLWPRRIERASLVLRSDGSALLRRVLIMAACSDSVSAAGALPGAPKRLDGSALLRRVR